MKIVLLSVTVIFVLFVILNAGITAFMFRTAIVRKGPVKSPWTREECFTEEIPRFSAYEDSFNQGRQWLHDIINGTASKEITITSFDGFKLCGRLLPHPNPRGVILMCHGYRSNPIRDFAAQARMLYNESFSLLMIDQRAHGGSEGKYLSYGVYERYDVRDWCRYLEKNCPGLPVVLYGVSMGASAVMMAVELDDLPANVRAAAADCGFTTPSAICRRVMKKRFHVPVFPVYYLNALITRLIAGYSLSDTDTREALNKTELPILIAHGQEDRFVPFSMGEENFSAARNADFIAPETAGHCCAFIAAPKEYTEAMRQLFVKAGI